VKWRIFDRALVLELRRLEELSLQEGQRRPMSEYPLRARELDAARDALSDFGYRLYVMRECRAYRRNGGLLQ
jgi:hypothetical protein